MLKRTFVLDCVTRTEGQYTIDLTEADALREHVDLEPAPVEFDGELRWSTDLAQ